MRRLIPKNNEYWWFQWGVANKPTIGEVIGQMVYQTGDDQGIPISDIHRFISRVIVPRGDWPS